MPLLVLKTTKRTPKLQLLHYYRLQNNKALSSLTYPESNIFPRYLHRHSFLSRYLHRHSFLFCLRAVFTFKIIIKSIPRSYHVKDVHVPDLLWYPQCAQWPPANVHVICLVSLELCRSVLCRRNLCNGIGTYSLETRMLSA